MVSLNLFFKQKTAYEIKECDWSSDVCSSDLHQPRRADGINQAAANGRLTGILHRRFSPNDPAWMLLNKACDVWMIEQGRSRAGAGDATGRAVDNDPIGVRVGGGQGDFFWPHYLQGDKLLVAVQAALVAFRQRLHPVRERGFPGAFVGGMKGMETCHRDDAAVEHIAVAWRAVGAAQAQRHTIIGLRHEEAAQPQPPTEVTPFP